MHITSPRTRRALGAACALLAGALATTLFAAPAAAKTNPTITISTRGPFCNQQSADTNVLYDITTTSVETLKITAQASSDGFNIAAFKDTISAAPDDGTTVIVNIPVLEHVSGEPNPPTAFVTIFVADADGNPLFSKTTDPVFYSCGEAKLTRVTSSVDCDEHGNTVIDWAVTLNETVPQEEPLLASVVDFAPQSDGDVQVTLDTTPQTVTKATPAHFIQKISSGDGTASIVIHLELKNYEEDPGQTTTKGDPYDEHNPQDPIEVDYQDCPEPTAVPTTQAPPTSQAAAPISLPVTGTSIVAFVGTALVLLGAGVGMLFLARRRRTTGQS